GELDAALADFTAAVEYDSRYVAAYNSRGVVRQEKGDFAGAVKDFSAAIKNNSRHAEAYANRGIAQLQQGRTAEGERDIAHAVALKPGLQPFIDRRIAEKLHR